jgi:hypothetical protein
MYAAVKNNIFGNLGIENLNFNPSSAKAEVKNNKHSFVE